jgi:hypothetical protein
MDFFAFYSMLFSLVCPFIVAENVYKHIVCCLEDRKLMMTVYLV